MISCLSFLVSDVLSFFMLICWFSVSIQSVLQRKPGCSPMASALVCFDVAANCPKAEKEIYNGPPPSPDGPSERCDRNELRQAALTFPLLFPPENTSISWVSEAEVALEALIPLKQRLDLELQLILKTLLLFEHLGLFFLFLVHVINNQGFHQRQPAPTSNILFHGCQVFLDGIWDF